MNGPKAVEAVFAATAFPLTVSTPGGGTATVNGQVIPSNTYYPTGTVVTLAATPNSGWSFLGWQGDATGTNNPLVLTINQTNNVQALFGTQVGVSVAGSGSILLSPPNPVPFGVASATGVAGPGYYFRVWSGAASGTNNPTAFLVTNAMPSVGALFCTVPSGSCTLNVIVNGAGTVSVDPQKLYYSLGDTVALNALAADTNSAFIGWAGDATGTANPLTLTLDTNKVVIASFGSAPSVTIMPPSQTVLVGSNAVLNAIGAGLPPLNYQWLRDFTPITSATNTSYTIYNAQPADQGAYRVIISNPYGTATSTVATITVVSPPSITLQPLSSTVAAGIRLQLIVGAAGTSPLSYQWFNGSGAVPGATDASYYFGPVQTNQAGSYYAVVTNPYGAATSSVAVVTVYIPVRILVQPASQIVTGYNIASFNVLAQGYPAPSYQWRFWGTNLPGATFSTLTITNVRLTDLGDYSVFVNNGYSSLLSANATLRMSPTITAPFIGATAIWGRSASLSVSAIGTAPLSYQWFKDGVLIGSATNQTFLIQTVQLGDGGMYSVVVSSPFGSVTNTAQLIVNPANMDLGMYSGITITGASGYVYQIQFTTDLTVTNSWTTLTNLTLEQPVELWVDTTVDARTSAHRFYRILPAP
jgi:hypothetical protein